eukprot:TRINITY_DN14723_c0_g1_i5.p1 TRINITY_DN14723_c0_g1~~TRINITY_DN14723_c0_g1_i5.p1  ORF type:complete len:491 (+),score=147.21 TRINITY_DN14723_c0_g1_i5:46-1473(+)
MLRSLVGSEMCIRDRPQSFDSTCDSKEAWKRTEALKDATSAVLRSETRVALPVVLELYSSTNSLLLKDACLHAIGLSLERNGLGEKVDLSEWVANTLGPEFTRQGAPQEQVVLHRRIIWFVGKATTCLSPELVEQFCFLMVNKVSQQGTDQVVRLTAAATLASLMEAIAEAPILRELEKEPDPIPLVRTLFQLFESVDSDILRGDLLKGVGGMMRMYRARSRARKRKEMPGWDVPWPAGEITLQAIQPLMQSVGDSMLLKSIVIDVMAQLVLCRVGGDVAAQFALQLIEPCMAMAETEDGILLRESGEKLWRDLLMQSPRADLVTPLFPRAVTLLEHDHGIELGEKEVPVLIHIVTDYMVISDPQFCVTHAPEALQSIMSYLASEEHTTYLRVALCRMINVISSILGGAEEFVGIMGPVYTQVFFAAHGGVAALWESTSSRYEIGYSLARVAMKSPQNLMTVSYTHLTLPTKRIV